MMTRLKELMFVGMCLSASSLGAQDFGAGPEGPGCGSGLGRGHHPGGPGGPGGSLLGDGPEWMQEKFLKDVDGGLAVWRQHEAKTKAIGEKQDALRQEMRQTMSKAADAQACKDIAGKYETQFKALLTERLDEQLDFAQQVLDLKKKNKELLLEEALKQRQAHRRGIGEGRGPQGRPNGPYGQAAGAQFDRRSQGQFGGQMGQPLSRPDQPQFDGQPGQSFGRPGPRQFDRRSQSQFGPQSDQQRFMPPPPPPFGPQPGMRAPQGFGADGNFQGPPDRGEQPRRGPDRPLGELPAADDGEELAAPTVAWEWDGL